MVAIEGKGQVKPMRVKVELTPAEIQMLKTESIRRMNFRRYRKRTDTWGQGLIRGGTVSSIGEIPCAALSILVGLCGEYGLRRHIGTVLSTDLSIDLSLRDQGDAGVDLEVFGYRLQVKTRKRDYDDNLIRFVDDRGCDVFPQSPHAFVFCQWELGTTVELLGWETASRAQQWTVKAARVGQHKNLSAEDSELRPIGRLISKLRAIRALKSCGEL